MTKIFLIFLVAVLIFAFFSYFALSNNHLQNISSFTKKLEHPSTESSPSAKSLDTQNSLSIAAMRQKQYPGSSITTEQTLSPGLNYHRYLVSYMSEGLKIYGLLTVPTGTKPNGGWPVILFNHGYIPPASYSTSLSYAVMVDPLAAAGYIVFKPDYRGNGYSRGSPTQPYITPDYITDSMNALASIRTYKDADPQKIGVFGHSMGGNITLHELEITHDIKAAELIAGVVGNESGLVQWWEHRFAVRSIVGNDLDTYYVFAQMLKDHGTPSTNPQYWNAIDPIQFINFINAPIQIQVGSADEDVPTNFSISLNDLLQHAGKTEVLKVYPGADHNLVPDTASAMATSVAFFNEYLRSR